MSEGTWLGPTTGWQVRNAAVVGGCIGGLLLLLLPLGLLLVRVRFRVGMLDRWLAQRLEPRGPLRSLRVYFYTLRAARALVGLAVLAVFALAAAALYGATRPVITWAHFRSRPLAVVFFALFVLTLGVAAGLWHTNQLSLAPHLTFVTSMELPVALVQMHNKVWADQGRSERPIRGALVALLTLALLFFSFANVFTIPFGECPSKNWTMSFGECDNMTAWKVKQDFNYKQDAGWHVAGNWLLLSFSTYFLVASAYFANYYLHAGADMIVDVQAQIAESLMRYGVSATQRALSSDTSFGGSTYFESMQSTGKAPIRTPTGSNVVVVVDDAPAVHGVLRSASSENNNLCVRFAGNSPTLTPSRPDDAEALGTGGFDAEADSDDDSLDDDDDDDDEDDDEEEEEEEEKGGARTLPPLPPLPPLLANKKVKLSVDTAVASGHVRIESPAHVQHEIKRASKALNGSVWCTLSEESERINDGERGKAPGQATVSDLEDQLARRRASTSEEETGSTVSRATSHSNGYVGITHSFMQRVLKAHARRMWRGFATCYAVSVLFLLAHAAAHTAFTLRTLAFFQSMGILMSDSVLLLQFARVSYRHSTVQAGNSLARVSRVPAWKVSVLMLLARIALASVPSDAWFLGQSVMFAIMAVFLSYNIIADYVHNMNSDSRRAATRDLCSRGSGRDSRSRGCWRSFSALAAVFCRELVLAGFAIYFGTLTAMLTLDDFDDMVRLGSRQDDDDNVAVVLWNDTIPQWKFGVCALLIWANYVAAYGALILCRRAKSQADRSAMVSELRQSLGKADKAADDQVPNEAWATLRLGAVSAVSAAVVLGLAVFSAWFVSFDLFAKTTDFSIVGTVATLLPAVLVGLMMHSTWAADDFQFWKDLPLRPPPAVQRAALEGRLDAGVAKHVARLRLNFARTRRRNVLMTFGAVFFVLCFVAWGASLVLEVKSMTFEFGISFPSAVLSFICGLLAAQLWFNTLRVTPSLLVLETTQIVLVVVAFVVGYEEVFEFLDSPFFTFLDTVLLLLILAPAFVLGGVALLVLRDDNFAMNKFVAGSLALCVILSAGVGGWIFKRFNAFAAVVYYLALLVVYAMAGLWLWWQASELDSSRSVRPSWMVGVAVACVVLGFVAIGAVSLAEDAEDDDDDESLLGDPLFGLSYFIIAYLVAAFFAVVWVLSDKRALSRDSTKLSPSPCVGGFPVIAFKVENRGGELLVINKTVAAPVLILLSVVVTGFVVSVVGSANAGVTISCAAVVLIEIVLLEASLARFAQFRETLLGLESLQGLDAVFERVLQEAVQRCLEISQQAMMTSWLGARKSPRADKKEPSAEPGEDQGDDDNHGQGAERDGGEEKDYVTVDSPAGLRTYYESLRAVEREHQQFLSDSAKYQALFHVLLWMRTTQLLMLRRARGKHLARPEAGLFAPSDPSNDPSSASTGLRTEPSHIETMSSLGQQPARPQSIVGSERDLVRNVVGKQVALEERTSSAVLKDFGSGGFDEASDSDSDDSGGFDEASDSDESDSLGELLDEAAAHLGLPEERPPRAKEKAAALRTRSTMRRNNQREDIARELERRKEILAQTTRRPLLQHRGSSSHRLNAIQDRFVHLTDDEAAVRLRAIATIFASERMSFADPDFPASNSSLFLEWDEEDEELGEELDPDDLMGALWCRARDIFPESVSCAAERQLCITASNGGKGQGEASFDPTEVMQGGVGDCWLLSAISVVALYPRLLERVLRAREPAADGVYHVKLFLDGKWENILVDDWFPCSLEQSLRFDPKQPHQTLTICDTAPDQRTGRRPGAGEAAHLPLPQYCRSRSGNVLWPLIIEKAFAKRFGSYEGLNGGHVHTALVDLTGGFSQIFSLQDDVEMVVSGALWDKLVEFHRRGALLAAGSPAMDESGTAPLEDGALSTDSNGIVHGHAYAIVRVEDQLDYNGHHRLLQLRDPWGVSRWRGPWSKYDRKRWTRRMQKRLSMNVDASLNTGATLRMLESKLGGLADQEGEGAESAQEQGGAGDGVFWISLEDFVASFKWLYVCQLFDEATWIQKSITDVWKGETAGGPPNQPGAACNPQFSVRLRLPQNDSRALLRRLGGKGRWRRQGHPGSTVRLFVSISNLQESQTDRDERVRGGEPVPGAGPAGEYDYFAEQSGRKYPFMSLLLLDLNGERLGGELLARSVVASTGKYKDSRDLSFETRIPCTEDVVYTIFPSLFPRGEEGTFRINVYCEADFELRKL